MSAGTNAKAKLELASSTDVSSLTLNTADFGRAELRAAGFGSMLVLKPVGGQGGIQGLVRPENGKTTTSLSLTDLDGTQKLQLNVSGEGKPALRLYDGPGRPALFSVP
jgi:hypothetical protein